VTALALPAARCGASGTGARSRPVPRCPRCHAVPGGGPVAYRCGPCGRGVMAADIDLTYHAPENGRHDRPAGQQGASP
jgi:hypothetical protein